MILVADIGASKGDWCIVNGKKTFKFKTIGFNPVNDLSMPFLNALKKIAASKPILKEVEAIYYYGTGIVDKNATQIVKNILKEVFRVNKIEVQSDMMAATRATCGNNSGVVCILGTGSNSCQYDGKTITDQVPSLGFLIGDEGGAADMAKELIRSYFYKELPPSIQNKFKKTFRKNKGKFLFELRNAENKAAYISKYARFLAENKRNRMVRKIIQKCLRTFIERHLLKYNIVNNEEVHFVGSIAQVFSSDLKKLLAEYNLKMGKVLKYPIDELVSFHKVA